MVVVSFLHAVACPALAPVSNSQADLQKFKFLLVDAILIAVEHSRRF